MPIPGSVHTSFLSRYVKSPFESLDNWRSYVLANLSKANDFPISKLHKGAARSARNRSAWIAALLAMFLKIWGWYRRTDAGRYGFCRLKSWPLRIRSLIQVPMRTYNQHLQLHKLSYLIQCRPHGTATPRHARSTEPRSRRLADAIDSTYIKVVSWNSV